MPLLFVVIGVTACGSSDSKTADIAVVIPLHANTDEAASVYVDDIQPLLEGLGCTSLLIADSARTAEAYERYFNQWHEPADAVAVREKVPFSEVGAILTLTYLRISTEEGPDYSSSGESETMLGFPEQVTTSSGTSTSAQVVLEKPGRTASLWKKQVSAEPDFPLTTPATASFSVSGDFRGALKEAGLPAAIRGARVCTKRG